MAASHPSSTSAVQNLIDGPRGSSCFPSQRLLKELKEFKSSQPKEILSLSPVDESKPFEHWEAKIHGPVDTPYANGVFVLDIHFMERSVHSNDTYPFTPPKIKFKTKVFHPNISSKGEICLDILHDQWAVALTIEKALLSIVALLSAPNTDDFLTPEAAFLYKENREEYDKKAREWTRIYATVDGVPVKAQNNLDELSDLTDTLKTMDMLSLSSDQIVQQEAVEIQPSERRRPARFNVIEPLQAKTFDNVESKGCAPIIAQCLWSQDDRQGRNKNQMYDFHDALENLNIHEELQSLSTALEKEGFNLWKITESEDLIKELCTLIDATPDKVAQGCLCLYSMEKFLYSKFNQFLREADETKIAIYRPFVRLLYFCFDTMSSIEVHDIKVYRGMDLSPAMIDTYKEAKESSIQFWWAAFSSTTKSREFAESFNTNTLFIMKLKKIYLREKKAIDISGYSQFPEEEEVLLKSGIEFTVEKVNYDNGKKKHYIYLNVYV